MACQSADRGCETPVRALRLAATLFALLALGGGCAPPAPPAVEAESGNPVLRRDFADPFLLAADGRFFAYATNSGGINVQVSSSPDLKRWSKPAEALVRLPAWAMQDEPDVWAPEVLKLGSRYLLYITARAARGRRADGNNRLCIGVAVSDRPDGGFVPVDQPLVCDPFPEGVIDASPFRDGERLFLYYKNDGNCCERPTWIWAQELEPSGLETVSAPVRLGLVNDQSWEGSVVEAPTMVKHRGDYYMFYSANAYDEPAYAVGYARCEGPMGPCEDAGAPILVTPAGRRPPWLGPGHQSVLEVGDRTFIAYHAWNVRRSGRLDRCRAMHIDELEWTADGVPVVEPAPGVGLPWSCPRVRRRAAEE